MYSNIIRLSYSQLSTILSIRYRRIIRLFDEQNKATKLSLIGSSLKMIMENIDFEIFRPIFESKMVNLFNVQFITITLIKMMSDSLYCFETYFVSVKIRLSLFRDIVEPIKLSSIQYYQ